jgi:hypothetical protein
MGEWGNGGMGEWGSRHFVPAGAPARAVPLR